MLQKIFQASQKYLCIDKFYCDETETLLLQFHDDLDEVGTTTILSTGHLRTPVCLRDFCRYITVIEAKWLEQNKPVPYYEYQEIKDVELCPGAQLIHENKHYAEYQHLITDEIINQPPAKFNFEERMQDILNYPKSKEIYNLYKTPQEDADFNVFNLGTTYCALVGGLNVVQSHDDIKIVVDTTRFVDDAFKCRFSVFSKDIELHFYSCEALTKDDYNYHFVLGDKTLVTMTLCSKSKNTDLSEVIQYKRNTFGNLSTRASSRRFTAPNLRSPKSRSAERNSEVYIKAVDFKFLQDKVYEKSLSERRSQNKIQINDMDENRFLSSLKRAMDEGRPVYKINRNYKYLKPMKFPTMIPLSSVLTRVMYNHVRSPNTKVPHRRFYPYYKLKSPEREPIEFAITLPNSLHISPCATTHSIKIKQQFLEKGPQIQGLDHEEYRIFCKSGDVLIKMKDGTIMILNHLGIMITYEKPNVDNFIGTTQNYIIFNFFLTFVFRRKL